MLGSSASVENQRQLAIAEYQLGGPEQDPEFDAITELAADLFQVPIALVTILTEERQVFQGACGLDISGTPREHAFCNRTVTQESVFVVEDALADPNYASNRLVTGAPFIRFYAGAPIRLHNGIALGALCLIDREPRQLTEGDARRLAMLARTVGDMIELRLGSRLAEERKQSLESQSELLRATIDHVQQGICLFDEDLRLLLWNDLLFELLGLPPELSEVGRSAEELLLAAARQGTFGRGDPQQIVAGLIHSIRTMPSRRLDLSLGDGRILDVWRSAIADGRSILTVQDVTEQRRTVRMKDEFVSTVSHELRTPLTSIRGALIVLGKSARGSLDALSGQMLDMAMKNAERLTVIINDILDAEKLGNGSLAMRIAAIDIGALLIEAKEMNAPFATSHQVNLLGEPPSEQLIVSGDHGRLLQAMTNLISNACKYSPAGETVLLAAVREGNEVVLSVTDKGPGIPVDFRPHIFGRFAQAGPDHQQGRAGSGLGLAISKAIVEQQGGKVGFNSEVGVGSSFWIRLPLRGATA
jgi:signal transduction histidine kinase